MTLFSLFFMTGFTGCVQYFNMTSNTLLVSEHSGMVDVWPSSSLIQSNCSSPGVCLPTPCSEEGTVWEGCLSTHCQNQWRCGPAEQNRSCMCLHNVSNHICDSCISTAESPDWCYELQDNLPVWLIAVFLPLISILVITGMFAALYRARQQNTKCKKDSLPQKTQQQADNIAFYFHNNRAFRDASAEKDKAEPLSADHPRSCGNEFYCDTNLSSVQLVPNSELEYYEIGNISSAHSDIPSVKLSWQKHYYSTKCGKNDAKQWGDLKMLLAGFKEGRSSKEMAKTPMKSQNVASPNKQILNNTDAEQSQHAPFCYMKRFLQPELLEHVQCLTFEEINKLSSPLEQTMLHRASSRSGSTKSTTMIHVSSGSETDSTFTCSESEYKEFSMISNRKYIYDQSSLSASFIQQDNLPVNTAADQYQSESTSSSMFVEWEKVLNMPLPFSSYAPVFEEIARLPVEPSYDIQSDTEEII